MASYAEEKGRRQRALRALKAAQRRLDTKLEIFERQIESQLVRKTILTSESGSNLAGKWTKTVEQIRGVEVALRDFITLLAD